MTLHKLSSHQKMLYHYGLFMILVILVISPTMLLSQTPEVLFDNANKLYQEQSYQKAIEFYQQILAQGYESAEVYYNMGNCYYRLNETGKAILFYEKALALEPNDSDIRYNLDMANLKVIDRIEMPQRFFLFEWWDALVRYFSLSELTRLLIIFYMILILALVIFLYLRRDRIRRYLLIIIVLMGLSTLFSGYLLYVKAHSYVNHRFGIVLSSTATVYSAPDENSTDVFILHEGLKVRMDEVRQEWVKISLPDGKSGWIETTTLGII